MLVILFLIRLFKFFITHCLPYNVHSRYNRLDHIILFKLKINLIYDIIKKYNIFLFYNLIWIKCTFLNCYLNYPNKCVNSYLKL